MKKYLLFLLFIITFYEGKSQIDNTFWYVAPEAAFNHGDRPIYLRISTMEDPANITLSMPANHSFIPINQSIAPNTTYSIDLTPWIDSIENKPANKSINRGLFLTSDNFVTTYYEIAHSNNPAIFPLKGKNALGTEFYIPGQNDYSNNATTTGTEAFDIIATEDSTWVTITPSIDIIGHPAGIPFLVFLNKGQTYSARTQNTTAAATLAGSHVTSTKPVAITISDDSITTGGWDIIGDQIIPVNLLGKDHIVVKGFADNVPPGNNDERVYVVAVKNNTSIYLDGSTTAFATLNTGGLLSYGIPSASSTVYIHSNEPVYVYHLSGNPGEAGSSLIPHDSCTGSRQIGFYRSGAAFFAMILLTRAGNEDAFVLNGGTSVITPSAFSPVAGTSGSWVYARMQMTPLQVPLGNNLLQNNEGKFHMGIINNLGGSSEYGFYSAYSSLYLGADRSLCVGDSLQLDAGPYMTSYEWYKKNGATWGLVSNARRYMVHDSGYYVAVVTGDNCMLSDTIHVSYYPFATVNLGNDTTICQSTTLTLDPGQYNTYFWQNGGNGRYFYATTPGIYWVRVTNNNGCAATDSVTVAVQAIPVPGGPITFPSPVCQGQSNIICSTAAFPDATSYNWTLPPGFSGTSTDDTIIISVSTSAVSDTIRVRGANYCGVSAAEAKLGVTVNPLPSSAKPIIGSNTVCQGATGIAYSMNSVLNATSYLWSMPTGAVITSGTGTNSITADFSLSSSSGTITVTPQNSCGTGAPSTFPVTVNLFPQPAGAITGPSTVCQGQTGVSFSTTSVTGADSLIWSLPAGISMISGQGTTNIIGKVDSSAVSGIISVRGKSILCGNGTESFFALTVNPMPSAAAAIAGPATVCQGQANVSYNIPVIPNATTYEWVLPAGAVITSGDLTNSIQVSFSTSAVSGNITVRGHNDLCGYGISSALPVTVNPLPAAAGAITGPNPVCQADSNKQYKISPVTNATSYIWNFTGTGSVLINNNSDLIINYSSSATSGTLTVKGNNSCGDGPVSGNFAITVNPIPLTTLNICTTITTHDAKPINLKGGIPLGGTYSGTAVSGSVFTPSMVPSLQDTVIINYLYTNTYGCRKRASQVINVVNNSFTCGNILTDVRDGKTYKTVKIGTQCWMAQNLNFGIFIPETQYATDNCVAEKYCFSNSPSMCDNNGGLYQWNELMEYDVVEGKQGICPPSWHIPGESEWSILFSQYTDNGFAGAPLKYSGFSGFNALLTGNRYENKKWHLDNFSTMMWSSTIRGVVRAWAHGFNLYNPSVSSYPAIISNGFSVRCIKD